MGSRAAGSLCSEAVIVGARSRLLTGASLERSRNAPAYGTIRLTRVPQLANCVRVPEQVGSCEYTTYGQVCATYSEATQMAPGRATAAP